MATSSSPKWGDHHVSGDLLHRWNSEHLQPYHSNSDNNWAGSKYHLHLLCHCLHHDRNRCTTTSAEQYCRYTWVFAVYLMTDLNCVFYWHAFSADVTGVIVSAINTTSVRVSWHAVQLPPDGILKGYTVRYCSLPSSSISQRGEYTSQTFSPCTTSGDINNLDEYQIYVVAEVTIMGWLYSGGIDASLAVQYSSICRCLQPG